MAHLGTKWTPEYTYTVVLNENHTTHRGTLRLTEQTFMYTQ